MFAFLALFIFDLLRRPSVGYTISVIWISSFSFGAESKVKKLLTFSRKLFFSFILHISVFDMGHTELIAVFDYPNYFRL